MIACLPLVEFESKFLTVMSSRVPCNNGIPITLITADCSSKVLYNERCNNNKYLSPERSKLLSLLATCMCAYTLLCCNRKDKRFKAIHTT